MYKLLLYFFQWEEVFDVTTGKWNFAKDCPSKNRVDDNEFAAGLGEAQRKRDAAVINGNGIDLFASEEGTCECEVTI